MATKCIVTKATLTAIADAIRARTGSTDTMKLEEMSSNIESIPSSGKTEEERTVTMSVSGKSPVAAVVDPTDDDHTMSKVTVNPPSGAVVPSGNVSITGTSSVNVSEYATAQVSDSNLVGANIREGLSILGVPGTLVEAKTEQAKTVTMTSLTATTVTPDSGKVLSSATVNPPSGAVIPSGNLQITTTDSVDVKAYATAQVVDSNLVAANIRKDIDILGVTGTYEGGSSRSDLVFDETTMSLDEEAYYGNADIVYAVFPVATSVGRAAFSMCSSLKYAFLPSVTSVTAGVFNACSNLIHADLESATTVGAMAFVQCGALTSLSLPNVTSIGSMAFRYATSLMRISLPKMSVSDVTGSYSTWSLSNSGCVVACSDGTFTVP